MAIGQLIKKSILERLFFLAFQSPIGILFAIASDKGICLLQFANDESSQEFILKTEKQLKIKLIEDSNQHLKQLKAEMTEYLKGNLKNFTVALDMIGTDFQKKVWTELLTIPYGEIRSYEQQSLNLGDVKAIRAVASANGKNKIAIIIPCHRVIGKDGKLTGYAGGLDKKKWLLDFESRNSGKSYQTSLEL